MFSALKMDKVTNRVLVGGEEERRGERRAEKGRIWNEQLAKLEENQESVVAQKVTEENI